MVSKYSIWWLIHIKILSYHFGIFKLFLRHVNLTATISEWKKGLYNNCIRMFNLLMGYTRYIFSHLQTPYQKIRNQRLTSSALKSDLWCYNDYFLYEIIHVVMTYALLLHIMLLYDACWYDIPYHDIMPVVVTYYAMTLYAVVP